MTEASHAHESGAMRAFLPGLVLGLVLGLGIGAFVMPFIESGGAPELPEASAAETGARAPTPREDEMESAFDRASEGLTPEQIREALDENRRTHGGSGAEEGARDTQPDANP